jgi:hypothetical protein
MSDIIERLFVDVPDKALTLANEEYVRTLAIGNDFVRLRIGIHCALDGPAENITGARLLMGLCAGKTKPFGVLDTTHWLGMSHGGASAPGTGTFTHALASGHSYYQSPGDAIIKRIGNTNTYNSVVNVATHRHPRVGATEKHRGIWMVEIIKGSTSFTVRHWYSNSNTTVRTLARFLEALENPASTVSIVLGDGTTFGPSASIMAVNEGADGALDTVSVFWNKSAIPLEIYAIAAYRFAS